MEKRFVYADHSATTPISKPVLNAMLPYLTEGYGNPSSIYSKGREAKKALESARGQVAEALHAKPSEIYFTSCGTESDNWAVRGAAYANNGNGVKVRDAVAQYIQEQLNGVIGSSYASAQGRISLEKTDEVFHDVKAAAYYADAVKWARENSIVNGTGKETFGPDANMTRAALWAVLGRAAGADVDGGSPWYQKALEWAKTEGISDGTNPNGSITRQELVTMLYRNAGKPAVSGDLAKFSDASAVASWASDAMLWAVSEGLVKGSGSNLNPTATATRAQVVTILYRLMEK